jgi:hypothetical protein
MLRRLPRAGTIWKTARDTRAGAQQDAGPVGMMGWHRFHLLEFVLAIKSVCGVGLDTVLTDIANCCAVVTGFLSLQWMHISPPSPAATVPHAPGVVVEV